MHLVLGAESAFGSAMVRALRARGLPLRVLSADRGAAGPGVEVVEGDARRLTDLVPAVKGCDSVIHALDLPMERWDPDLLELTDNVAEAAGLSGAAVVYLGDLFPLKTIYAVPLPAEAPLRDVNDRPSRPGRVRGLVEGALVQNSEVRNIRTLMLRAGDLFGPGVDDAVVAPMFCAALAGEPIPWYGPRAAGHAFTYVDDVASVATELLLRSDRPTLEHVNVAGDTWLDADAWAQALGTAAGRTLQARPVPPWLVRLRALWSPDARAVAERLYQWEAAMLLDDTRTRRALPDWAPTPPEVSLAATMAWYRERR